MSDRKTQMIFRISAAVETHRRFLVVTHVRPDGDAIGSLLAMTFLLRKLGREAVPFSQDPVPSALPVSFGRGRNPT